MRVFLHPGFVVQHNGLQTQELHLRISWTDFSYSEFSFLLQRLSQSQVRPGNVHVIFYFKFPRRP